MNRLFYICILLIITIPMAAQKPVKQFISGGITYDTSPWAPGKGPSKKSKSGNKGININGDIRGYSIEELADQIRANADAQAEELQARLREEMERERRRREEEARIKAAGDNYVRSTNPYFYEKKADAHWEATVGKSIVRDKTAMENYFTPGTRIIEKDDSQMDIRPINTTTNKSGLAAKLKQRREEDSGPILSSDMSFVPLNARASDYLKDVVKNNYQPSYYQYDNFVRLDMSSRSPSLSERMNNALDRTLEWAENRRQDGANALLNTSIAFCVSVAKSSITGINAMAGQVMNAYDIVSNIGDVVNHEKGIIDGSLDLIKNHWDDKDYWDKAERFMAKKKGESERLAFDLISDNLNISPSKTVKNSASSWFIRIAKD